MSPRLSLLVAACSRPGTPAADGTRKRTLSGAPPFGALRDINIRRTAAPRRSQESGEALRAGPCRQSQPCDARADRSECDMLVPRRVRLLTGQSRPGRQRPHHVRRGGIQRMAARPIRTAPASDRRSTVLAREPRRRAIRNHGCRWLARRWMRVHRGGRGHGRRMPRRGMRGVDGGVDGRGGTGPRVPAPVGGAQGEGVTAAGEGRLWMVTDADNPDRPPELLEVDWRS